MNEENKIQAIFKWKNKNSGSEFYDYTGKEYSSEEEAMLKFFECYEKKSNELTPLEIWSTHNCYNFHYIAQYWLHSGWITDDAAENIILTGNNKDLKS